MRKKIVCYIQLLNYLVTTSSTNNSCRKIFCHLFNSSTHLQKLRDQNQEEKNEERKNFN